MACVNAFYFDQTKLALTTAWQQISLPVQIRKLICVNNDSTNIEFSFRSDLTLGAVVAPDKTIVLDDFVPPVIFIRGSTGGEDYNLMLF